MSVQTLTMPRLGETMDEAVIVQWLVAEGARYGRGDAILEIETDKTVAEVPALHEGRLLRILAQSGQRIAVGEPIAEVEGPVEAGPTEAAPGRDMTAPVPTPAAVPTPTPALPVVAPPVPAAAGGVRATPLARRLARQRGIALESVQGTGRRGRTGLSGWCGQGDNAAPPSGRRRRSGSGSAPSVRARAGR